MLTIIHLLLWIVSSIAVYAFIKKRYVYLVLSYYIFSQIYPTAYPQLSNLFGVNVRLDDFIAVLIIISALMQSKSLIFTSGHLSSISKINRAVFFYILVNFISWFYSLIMNDSLEFDDRILQIRVLMKTVEIILVMVAVSRLIKTTSEINMIFKGFVFISGLQAIVVILSFLLPSLRDIISSAIEPELPSSVMQIGFLYDKNIVGFCMVVSFWIVFLTKISIWNRFILLSVYGICVAVCGSKTALITLGFTLPLGTLLCSNRQLKTFLGIFNMVAFTSLAFAVSFEVGLSEASVNQIVDFFNYIAFGQTGRVFSSAQAHYYVIIFALYVIVYSPIFGFGPAGFSLFPYLGLDPSKIPYFSLSRDAETFIFNTEGHWGGDNQYLTVLFSSGLLGIITFLMIWYLIIYSTIKCWQNNSQYLFQFLTVLSILLCFFGKSGFYYFGNSLFAFVSVTLGVLIANLSFYIERKSTSTLRKPNSIK